MRGHEAILRSRQKGAKPAEFVEILLQPWPKGDWATTEFRRGRVFVEPADTIDLLDLRFTVGCDVMVDGEDAQRVERLYAALQRHKARRVIASCGGVRAGQGYIDVILDTQEDLTWRA